MITTSIFLALLPILVIGAILAFEVLMFIDAIRNPRLTSDERLLWCIGMLLVHPFVAIAYFLVARSKLHF